LQTSAESKDKSNFSMKTLLLITLMSLISKQLSTTAIGFQLSFHIRIPAIKCTRTLCTKTFLKLSLSIISAIATFSQFYKYLNVRKQMDVIGLIQSSSNKWLTIHLWMVRSQMHIYQNFVLIQGEILLYDRRGLVSNLDDIKNYMHKRENYDTINHCLYRRIGRINAARYSNHFVNDELLIISEKSNIINTKNCRFTFPFLMQARKLVLMENSPVKAFDPENIKFQYLFDSLRQEFLQQLKETYQRSCQNRNNYYYWSNARLMFQRNDVIAKRVDGNLMYLASRLDLSKRLAIKNIEFKRSLLMRDESFWQKIFLKFKLLKLLQSLFCTSSKRNSNETIILTLPVESPQTQFITKKEIPAIKLYIFRHIPEIYSIENSH
uniref:Ycf1 n=1 Tax=Brugia timori TaxID=42155 RepID=A0A0R3QSZ0_9BILA